ncbi:MAG: hypothetical protein KGJ31_01910 [Patescibacteria group bacterium]|nr:hypothetical protein [Patescibacteria group bacterium]
MAQFLLDNERKITLAFEWVLSGTELEELQGYVTGGRVPEHLPTFFLHSDGRFTYEHVALLKWIRACNLQGKKMDIYTFDRNDPPASDKDMADILLSYKENHPESVILVETGNRHARNSSYSFEGVEQVPMASILKESGTIFSIFCRYKEGSINVDGTSRDVTNAVSQIEGPGAYFDAVLEVPFSVAAENIRSLTSISGMLTI